MTPPHPHQYSDYNSSNYNIDGWTPHFSEDRHFKNQSHHGSASPPNGFSVDQHQYPPNHPNHALVSRHSSERYSQMVDNSTDHHPVYRTRQSRPHNPLPLQNNQNAMNNYLPSGRREREEWREYNQCSQQYERREERGNRGNGNEELIRRDERISRHRLNSEISGHSSSSSDANEITHRHCNLSPQELREYAAIIQDLWADKQFVHKLKMHSITDYCRLKMNLEKIQTRRF